METLIDDVSYSENIAKFTLKHWNSDKQENVTINEFDNFIEAAKAFAKENSSNSPQLTVNLKVADIKDFLLVRHDVVENERESFEIQSTFASDPKLAEILPTYIQGLGMISSTDSEFKSINIEEIEAKANTAINEFLVEMQASNENQQIVALSGDRMDNEIQENFNREMMEEYLNNQNFDNSLYFQDGNHEQHEQHEQHEVNESVAINEFSTQETDKKELETNNDLVLDPNEDAIFINGQEFQKRKLNNNQEDLLLAALKMLQSTNMNNNLENYSSPTPFVKESGLPLSSFGSPDSTPSNGGGKGGIVKNYSLFPSLGNMFKDHSQASLQALNQPIATNLDSQSVINNRVENIKDSVTNNEVALQNVVANQLICEKYNSVLDAHHNYSQNIEKFWKHDRMDDFQGELIEYAKNNNKDINSVVEEMNAGDNEPLRKSFQDHVSNMEVTENGKNILSELHSSHRNFMNKSNVAYDVLKNGNIEPSLKDKLHLDLNQVIENQEQLSSKIPSYIDNEGQRIDLGSEMKKYAESIKNAFKAVVDFVKSKAGFGQSNDSPSPTP